MWEKSYLRHLGKTPKESRFFFDGLSKKQSPMLHFLVHPAEERKEGEREKEEKEGRKKEKRELMVCVKI